MQETTKEMKEMTEIDGNPVRYVYEDSTGYWAVCGKNDFFTRSYMLTRTRYNELKIEILKSKIPEGLSDSIMGLSR